MTNKVSLVRRLRRQASLARGIPRRVSTCRVSRAGRRTFSASTPLSAHVMFWYPSRRRMPHATFMLIALSSAKRMRHEPPSGTSLSASLDGTRCVVPLACLNVGPQLPPPAPPLSVGRAADSSNDPMIRRALSGVPPPPAAAPAWCGLLPLPLASAPPWPPAAGPAPPPSGPLRPAAAATAAAWATYSPLGTKSMTD